MWVGSVLTRMVTLVTGSYVLAYLADFMWLAYGGLKGVFWA